MAVVFNKLKSVEEFQDASKDMNKDKPSLIPVETMEIAKLNRKTYWKEFLSRHPYRQHKLMAVRNDMKSAREERNGLDEQLKVLSRRLHDNLLEVERTNWEQTKAAGKPVDGMGKIMLSEDEKKAIEEQEAIHQEYRDFMKTFKHFDYHYAEVAYKFHEAHEAANKMFTEYLATTYWNVLAVPGVDDDEENIPILGVNVTKKPTAAKSEEIFVELQNNNLNEDRRDPPHRPWLQTTTTHPIPQFHRISRLEENQ